VQTVRGKSLTHVKIGGAKQEGAQNVSKKKLRHRPTRLSRGMPRGASKNKTSSRSSLWLTLLLLQSGRRLTTQERLRKGRTSAPQIQRASERRGPTCKKRSRLRVGNSNVGSMQLAVARETRAATLTGRLTREGPGSRKNGGKATTGRRGQKQGRGVTQRDWSPADTTRRQPCIRTSDSTGKRRARGKREDKSRPPRVSPGPNCKPRTNKQETLDARAARGS